MFSPDDIEALRGQDQIEAFPVATERNAPGTALARRDTAVSTVGVLAQLLADRLSPAPRVPVERKVLLNLREAGGIQRNAYSMAAPGNQGRGTQGNQGRWVADSAVRPGTNLTTFAFSLALVATEASFGGTNAPPSLPLSGPPAAFPRRVGL